MSERPQNLEPVYGAIREKLRAELDFLPDVKSREEIYTRDDLRTADVIFSTWGMIALSKDEITKYFPNLRSVFYAAGTVQGFARPFIGLGINVSSAWRANGVSVSEVAASEIILANKGFFRRRVKSRAQWNGDDPGVFYPGNYKTRVGILGAGAIGKKVIELLSKTDLEILVFDPFLPDEEAERLRVTKCGLHEIFRTCNVISNHLANNDGTRGMIDKSCFDLMGDHAVFINTGRGAQVVPDDLISALKEKPGRAALLDVTDPCEPPEEKSPLYFMDNVFLTPHIAGSTGYEVRRMAEYMYEEYRRFVQGEKLLFSVSEKMLETMA